MEPALTLKSLAPPAKQSARHKGGLASRKPRLLFLFVGSLLFRFAARAFWLLLLKLPPRITRCAFIDPSPPPPLLWRRSLSYRPRQNEGAAASILHLPALCRQKKSRAAPFGRPTASGREEGKAKRAQANKD
jgi:hypothetical protein